MIEKDTAVGAKKASSLTMKLALNVMLILIVASLIFKAFNLTLIADKIIFIAAVIISLSPIIVTTILVVFYIIKKSKIGSILSTSVLAVLIASALISYYN